MDLVSLTGCEQAHYEPLTRILRVLRPAERPKIKIEDQGLKVCVFFICAKNPGAGKFVYDMISRWLIPSKRLSIALFFTTDFTYQDGEWTAGELSFKLNSLQELEEAKKGFKRLVRELEMGLSSQYFAQRILEMKGLSGEEKLAHVQDRLAELTGRFAISQDVLMTLQHFASVVSKLKIRERSIGSLTRLMLHLHNLFEQNGIKLLPQVVDTPLGFCNTLGVVVGRAQKGRRELFDHKQALKALRAIFPNCNEVIRYARVHPYKHHQLLYIEIEKKSGKAFSLKDVRECYERLPDLIEASAEKLVHPMARMRNEEEVMRNLITLGKEIRFVSDTPQVMVSFEKQTEKTLVFTILVVATSELVFDRGFELERVREMDIIRGKQKRAYVLRHELKSKPFLRSDHVIDVFGARKHVVKSLGECIGPFRDFNGGIITREQENFEALCNQCPDASRCDLENFFYALEPASLRIVLSPEELTLRYHSEYASTHD